MISGAVNKSVVLGIYVSYVLYALETSWLCEVKIAQLSFKVYSPLL